MATNSSKPTRRVVSLSLETAQAIADYRFANRIGSEAEAIRQIIEAGLAAIHKPTQRTKKVRQ
jgi:hypothetical protein